MKTPGFRRPARLFLLALLFLVLAAVLLMQHIPQTQSRPEEHLVGGAAQTDPVPLPDSSEPAGETVRVILDPGHGGKDPGCSSRNVEEKELTLAIVQKAAALLEQAGYEVVLTRTEDSYISKEERVTFAAQQEGDLFISVHLNALEGDADTYGIETYCNEAVSAGSRALAEEVQRQVTDRTGGKSRGVFDDSDYYVVHHATMPACLLEAGFLTAQEEGALLMQADYQQKVAEGIAAAVEALYPLTT